MRIGEIVKLDTQGQFIPAVQLSDYDSPKTNLGLVRTYIFAKNPPDTTGQHIQAVASIGLLKILRNSIVNESPNRFVVVANYGHGKSHLAVVLANYFGKSYHSEEVQEVLKRIDGPLQNDQDEAANYYDLKQQNDRFLVIRLRGDVPRSLREQLFPAMKLALQEQFEDKAIILPFWNDEAILWLKSKVNDTQAEQFLEDLDTDIPTLIKEVEENEQGAYEQYVDLFAHLNKGVKPREGGNVSLREALLWVTDEVCGEGKPLSGVLVLFDEFSQFIERYCQSNGIGELQDLLQGIGDRKGKALFLALTPLDPDDVASRITNGHALLNIQRELNRIDKKFLLYSLMESVLNASINPTDRAWEKFLSLCPENIRGFMYGQAGELVWGLYNDRYQHELRWTNDKYRDVIIKGCFPLHPLTTALLCHLKMQQGLNDDPRTILRFVRDIIGRKLDQDVIVNGKINWVLPIEMADYFGKRITSEKIYASYLKAIDSLEQAFGDDVTQNHYDILKALLIQFADGINLTGGRQVELLAHMIGDNYETTLKLLKVLIDRSVIKFDPVTKFNSFYQVADNPQALEQRIQDLLAGRRFGDGDELYDLNSMLKNFITGTEKIEVSIEWGHPTDWAAQSEIVTREKFTPEYIKKVFSPYQLSYQGLQEGNRGLVVWLLALDDSEIEYFQQNASRVLAEAFPSDFPPPVLVILPSEVNSGVADYFMRFQALKSIERNPDAIREIGRAAFEAEQERTKRALKNALAKLFGDEERFASIQRRIGSLSVPQPYRAILQTIQILNIQSVLQSLYKVAYPNRPPAFFTDLPGNPSRGQSQLREAVKVVSKNLIRNGVSSAMSGMSSLGKDRLCQSNLTLSWHLLSTTGFIQEPDVLSLKRAWDLIDSHIRPDEKETRLADLIPALFNSPYGFDFNTATLLLCAWIGYHNKELRYFENGRAVGLDHIEHLLSSKPQDFIGEICVSAPLFISRKDADHALTEGRSVVTNIQKGEQFSQRDASDTITTLKEIVDSGICPESEINDFTGAIKTLTDHHAASLKYDQDVKRIQQSINGTTDIERLLDIQETIQKLPISLIVIPTEISITELQSKLDSQIKKVVDGTCHHAENLDRIEGADAIHEMLKKQKGLLLAKGRMELVNKITSSEGKLDARIRALKIGVEEAALRKEINAMTSKADLLKLYEYRNALSEIKDITQEINIAKSKKLDEINSAIAELEKFAEAVCRTYMDIDPSDANKYYELLLTRSSKYNGSRFEEDLNKARSVLKHVKNLSNDIREIERLPLQTPEDIPQIQGHIKQLRETYTDLSGTAYQANIERVQTDFENRVQKEYEKSVKWVTEIESTFDTLPCEQIRQKLTRPFQFIADETLERIEHLRISLEQREADERRVRIENETHDVIERIMQLFESIQDPNKRQECLEMLQKKATIPN